MLYVSLSQRATYLSLGSLERGEVADRLAILRRGILPVRIQLVPKGSQGALAGRPVLRDDDSDRFGTRESEPVVERGSALKVDKISATSMLT